MVICFYKRQAELLLEQISFEVDMSFKRIRQKNMNEIIFANFMPNHGKSRLRTRSEQVSVLFRRF